MILTKRKSIRFFSMILLIAIFAFSQSMLTFAQKKVMTVEDFGVFKNISGQRISNNGEWVAYTLKPAKGDGEVIAVNLKNGQEYKIEKGSSPAFSDESNWLKCSVLPHEKSDAEKKTEKEKAKNEDKDKEKEKKEKNKLCLLNLKTGEKSVTNEVESSKFADDSKWLAYKLFKPEEDKDKQEKPDSDDEKKTDDKKKKKTTGTEVVLMELKSGLKTNINDVMLYEFTENSKLMYYTVASKENSKDGLYVKELGKDTPETGVLTGKGKYTNLTLSEDKDKLFLFTDRDDQDSKKPKLAVYSWTFGETSANMVFSANTIPNFPENKQVATYNPSWSKDGNSIFFHLKDLEPEEDDKKELDGVENASVDIWHWKDVDLQPMQEIRATGKATGSTYGSTRNAERYTHHQGVFHLDSKSFVRLTDDNMTGMNISPDGKMGVGSDPSKYEFERPWFPNYSDYYVVDLKTGDKRELHKMSNWGFNWSKNNEYIMQYFQPHWYVYDVSTGEKRCLTDRLDIEFWNTDDDRTDVKRSWGTAGWTKDDEGILLYDKFDIWYFPIKKGGDPINVTKGLGREWNARFRYTTLDREEEYIDIKKPMLLIFTDFNTYASGYYEVKMGKEPKKIIKLDKSIQNLTKAEDSDKLMFRVSTNEEYPDIWVSDKEFKNMKKISDANPDNNGFLWSKAQLIEYTNMDGVKLKATLKLPENYVEGKKYPMIVYMYERLTNDHHRYIVPRTGTTFPDAHFLSQGYIYLKPDIIYTAGHPGQSALKCIVPAAQKVIDMGLADPDKIGITGHSWGGYQVAYIVTQTDMFACTYSGAPVGNMTSAYSGIRWGSGMPRQFQYERTQSRLGGSLWDVPERYIENSPVFFADRVNTPVLLLHGDEDTAVPWYQSIELFLALRRNDKPSWFLQYNKEPHGLRKEANKKDLTIRRLEFFDHYLKDAPMPDWMKAPVPFKMKGKK